MTNTGSLPGSEVAQLYVGFPSCAGEPPQQLKGFQKVKLIPGQSAAVSFPLNDRTFSIWDVTSHSWQLVHGTYTFAVGSSSRDIRAKAVMTI